MICPGDSQVCKLNGECSKCKRITKFLTPPYLVLRRKRMIAELMKRERNMSKRKYTWKCPIKGVSKDCGYCLQDAWYRCVYVKAWKARQRGCSKSSSYVPLTVSPKEIEKK